MVSRAKRTLFGEWWWTVDRTLLGALAAIVFLGIVLLLAASPPLATRLGVDPFYFVNRQAFYLIPAFAVMIGASLLTPRQIRRVALIVFVVSFVLVLLTLFIGAEVKGARRWLSIFGVSLQPSELLKPSFIVLSAWAFSESKRNPEMPSTALAFGSLIAVMILLVRQPDIGQTVLIALAWCALFFVSGMCWVWVGGLIGPALFGFLAAYSTIHHVRKRVDRFLDPASGDTFQIDTAIESFLRGGWLGRGPGEGTVKRILPDGHADFIFAVGAEEFGIVLCLILVALFAFVVIRSLMHAAREEDPFVRLAIVGIAILFALQSSIAMAVNLHLIPSKGMTLPFVSYGGSSLISLAFGMGMLLSLTRKHPRLRAYDEEMPAEGARA
ncbi:MAG TPA: putative peptidoglycan glycosyltransferase FtsW [Xanthobacteraceae bacterium]|nr:putative peptidoglycan glycosyltransferase FtsW [Xanthobacteraceae bacterium]